MLQINIVRNTSILFANHNSILLEVRTVVLRLGSGDHSLFFVMFVFIFCKIITVDDFIINDHQKQCFHYHNEKITIIHSN